jgi:hypothetical protein
MSTSKTVCSQHFTTASKLMRSVANILDDAGAERRAAGIYLVTPGRLTLVETTLTDGSKVNELFISLEA